MYKETPSNANNDDIKSVATNFQINAMQTITPHSSMAQNSAPTTLCTVFFNWLDESLVGCIQIHVIASLIVDNGCIVGHYKINFLH